MNRLKKAKNVLTKLMEKLAPLAPEEYDDERIPARVVFDPSQMRSLQASNRTPDEFVGICEERHPSGLETFVFELFDEIWVGALLPDGQKYNWNLSLHGGAVVRDLIAKFAAHSELSLTWDHAATLDRLIRRYETN